MQLTHIPAKFVDQAWKDGAHLLGESCVEECTPDQLKTLIAQDARVLIRMDDEGKAVGWGAFRIEQLPNMRVLFITNLAARGAKFERFFQALKEMAAGLGCSRIRCAAQPLQAKLFQMKCGFQPVYEILEVST